MFRDRKTSGGQGLREGWEETMDSCGVSFWGVEDVLEFDSSDGCTAR